MLGMLPGNPIALAQPVINKVGLQLLLEPSTSSILFNSASVAVGAVYPAYATYKLLVRERLKARGRAHAGSSSSPAGGSGSVFAPPTTSSSSSALDADKLMKYWTVAGSLYVAERLLEPYLSKFPYYAHTKFALLMWLLMDQCKGATQLFDCHIVPALTRYEVKIDVCLEAGYQGMSALYAIYRIPLQQAATLVSFAGRQALHFLRWLVTPDEPAGPPPGSSSSSPPGSGWPAAPPVAGRAGEQPPGIGSSRPGDNRRW